MAGLRRPLILIHRYLGIVLCLLFLMWFVSGIAMIYARGMPTLTPDSRLERLPALDFGKIRLTPAEAAEKTGVQGSPRQALLLTVMDRPAYRFGGAATIFADTGEPVDAGDRGAAMQIASLFTGLPEQELRYEGVLTSPDQWTIGQYAQMPLHKILVDDGLHTELYVSGLLGEVVVQTTRKSRALAWIAAIPHWLYFAPLRVNGALWSQVVIWTSVVAFFSTLIGLILAVVHYRRTRPYIPYAGWLRWHYITGAIFGVFTLTWVFSGLLSMEPWNWNRPEEGLGAGMIESMTGGPLELTQFPSFDAAAWTEALPDRKIKEIELLRIQGDAFYAARSSMTDRVLLSANPLAIKKDPFSVESLMNRLKEPNPDVPIVESTLLSEYDSYYYTNDGRAPLPVLRVKFGDPYKTWFYVDPMMGRIVARYHKLGRLERWIYHGFHSLDFSFWYRKRPLWDIGVIGLSLGGVALSGIGVVISAKRLARAIRRKR